MSELLGGDVSAEFNKMVWTDYKDARNHFEHIDDRLFGTSNRKPNNIPQPLKGENGSERTIHFGLKANAGQPIFEWGVKKISISQDFLIETFKYTQQILDMTVELAKNEFQEKFLAVPLPNTQAS